MNGDNDVEAIVRANLTEAQADAALDRRTRILALACAGSGKSRTLGYRVADLVARGVQPERIVAFSFTNKAADSLRQRVATALHTTGQNELLVGRMSIGTIDSFTKAQLGGIDARYRQFEQLDPTRMAFYIMSRYPQIGVQRVRGNGGMFKVIKGLRDAWEVLQNEGFELEEIREAHPELAAVLQALRERLEADGYIDFASAARIVADGYEAEVAAPTGRLARIEHLLVDEYQDVNTLQQRLIDAILANGASLFAVGDDDQAIFGFRGADVTNITTFEHRYPGAAVHELGENFRSSSAIVAASSTFAQAELGANRLPKHPYAHHEDTDGQDFGVFEFDTREDEAAFVASRIASLVGTRFVERDGRVRGLTPSDFAILMKSTRRGDQGEREARHVPYTAALDRRGIPYVVESTGDLFDRPYSALVKDSFELLRAGSPDRQQARAFFQSRVLPVFPDADENAFYESLTAWGRRIHAPRHANAPRQRLLPQALLHDLLEAFRYGDGDLPQYAHHDLGTVSRILADIEAVYVSIDGPERWASILNGIANIADGAYDAGTDEVTSRPDSVFVSTIHKAKGLEFPVVFIVDCRHTQYPGNRSGYSGLLPQALMADAVGRGSYTNNENAAARVFYTALTRAERQLYVTMGREVGNTRSARLSRYGARLVASGANQDPAAVSAPGLPTAGVRRIDEDEMPTTFSEIRFYLRCPHDYRMRHVYGFAPPINEMFGFGQSVHTGIGKVHEEFVDVTPTPDDAERVMRETFQLKHAIPSGDPVGRPGGYENAREAAATIARRYVDRFADDFTERRQVEVQFEIPLRACVVSGAIDLLVRRDQNGVVEAEIIDFKAIRGETPGSPDPVDNEDLDWNELSLQVQLYALAASEVLGENARTGSVHLLKDNLRVDIPIDAAAVEAAKANIQWAVDRVVAGDFPMRPETGKCSTCDFKKLCPKTPQNFSTQERPPDLQLPGGRMSKPRAFDE